MNTFKALALSSAQIKMTVEFWTPGKRPRWKVSGSVRGLCTVNHVMWLRDGKHQVAADVEKDIGVQGALALALQRNLQRHIDAVAPFIQES
jgi:hypothetical protein